MQLFHKFPVPTVNQELYLCSNAGIRYYNYYIKQLKLYLNTRALAQPNPRTNDSVNSMLSALISGTNCFRSQATDGLPITWNIQQSQTNKANYTGLHRDKWLLSWEEMDQLPVPFTLGRCCVIWHWDPERQKTPYEHLILEALRELIMLKAATLFS